VLGAYLGTGTPRIHSVNAQVQSQIQYRLVLKSVVAVPSKLWCRREQGEEVEVTGRRKENRLGP
jgi:hypothetical protein